MKSGSGGASAPSAGAGSLAIAERQKPAPSCVAVLFQMFARRKLFSSSSKKSKLLPPDYSRSKIEGNGTNHYPQPGQDRDCGENEMCAPGVVARLMGLSSMPAVSHQRPTKATDFSELGDHRNPGLQGWSGTSRSIYTSPQKQQKTGQAMEDQRQDNGSQFSSPDTRSLWPRRHAHKVASPVKSPRSMSSRNKARLIEAAVKNALPVACREADPGYMVQRNKHRSGKQNARNTAQDFVSLNKRMTGSKSLRSKRKELGRFGESHTRAENKNMTTKGSRSSNLHSDTSSKLKLKTLTPKAMEKEMIIAKGAGLRSPVGACPKRQPRRYCQNTSPQRGLVFREDFQVDSVTYGFRDNSKQVMLCETHKKHEADAKGCNPSPSISRGSNKKSPTSILQSTYADDTFILGIPLNTAEATFTDSHPTETCTPAASMQDVTTERNSRRSGPNFGQQHGAQPFEPEVQDSKLRHPGEEVTTTVELLLTNVRSSSRRESKEPSKTFLLRTIESALATLTPGSKQDLNAIKAKEASSLRNLALDLVWDCLDSMCTQLCDSGYRSFTKLGLICTEERLAEEVEKEIASCSDMAGRGLDELAVREVEHAAEAGMNSMLEAFQIGAQIEQDLVQELVNEIGLDMFKHW
ncbi:hypothetical protein BAE44_0018552 [Dichanthelium oligosanthes]|uniref:DUF3741 domain-containing protein n=1 Tax=Dichanthelium oligosanthes TaxID=888268 RepID=A0A1E5V5J3_9POAL|nr:hypothetical protein BAE44_0018552 [Dichanthelium oligosanthes]